jgi:hypothetical protein
MGNREACHREEERIVVRWRPHHLIASRSGLPLIPNWRNARTDRRSTFNRSGKPCANGILEDICRLCLARRAHRDRMEGDQFGCDLALCRRGRRFRGDLDGLLVRRSATRTEDRRAEQVGSGRCWPRRRLTVRHAGRRRGDRLRSPRRLTRRDGLGLSQRVSLRALIGFIGALPSLGFHCGTRPHCIATNSRSSSVGAMITGKSWDGAAL